MTGRVYGQKKTYFFYVGSFKIGRDIDLNVYCDSCLKLPHVSKVILFDGNAFLGLSILVLVWRFYSCLLILKNALQKALQTLCHDQCHAT